MPFFYDFQMTAIDGKTIDFQAYKGKKVIILNTASECGYTAQYADWQLFHEKYSEEVAVLGFPCNDFGGQEPDSEATIATFCQKNYGVTFQLFEKVSVKGEGKSPLYEWLTTPELNGWNAQAPTWNFCKYVINDKGELEQFYPSGTLPHEIYDLWN